MAKQAKRKETALRAAMKKSELLGALSDSTGLHKKDVGLVLDELGTLIARHLKRRAVGVFTLPGLLKIEVARKPARKARRMILPFSGEEISVPAKPASRTVRIRPLTGLRRMAE